MKRYLQIAAAICLACVAGKMNAQECVKGRIVDEQQSPVAGASCILMSLRDSSQVAGTTTDAEGLFELRTGGGGSICSSVLSWGMRR